MPFSLIPPWLHRWEPLLVVFSPTTPSLCFLHCCFFSINILFLTQLNTGDQSLVAMTMKPPMQVCVCVRLRFLSVHSFFWSDDCTCLPAVRAVRPPVVMLLSCTALTFSGFDSCLVEMRSPATFGFLSALCRIMTKFKG